MIWKLLHKLCGFHYILFSYGTSDYVKRIRITPNGKYYVTMMGEIYLFEGSVIPGRNIRHLTLSKDEEAILTDTNNERNN